jgi:hypothetical protein
MVAAISNPFKFAIGHHEIYRHLHKTNWLRAVCVVH